MSWLRPRHVRARLTLWYVAAFAPVLLISMGCVFALMFWQLQLQLQRHVVQDIETIEGLLYFDPLGRLDMHEGYHNHAESRHVQERLVEVLDDQGRVLYRNERLGARALDGPPFPGEGINTYSVRNRRLADGTRILLASRHHYLGDRPILIRLAYNEEGLWDHAESLMAAGVIALPLMLFIAGIAGYAMARRALAPLEEMARRAEAITPNRLHERLPDDGADDELGRLARVFNQMLARLEQSFEQLKRFTSDVSHELRTPLAAIRSVGEVGLQKDGSREAYRDMVGSMLEEVTRLTELVESLLTISRADAGAIELHPTPFSLDDLIRETQMLFEVLLEERNQRLELAGDTGVILCADRLLLRQVLVNLLHNAIKFSPSGGLVRLTVTHRPGEGTDMTVEDSGPGIAEEHRPYVFDRFYRADRSRSREQGGSGLGLSIVKWVVETHGGTVTLEESSLGGALFRIILPPDHV